MKAYSYVRFSTAEQSKGDSLRRQVEDSAAYAKKHGLTLDESLRLRDLGVSAFKGKNAATGALGAFLQAVETGRVAKGSILIVESLDRLSRDNLDDAYGLFRSIIKSGIKIVTLKPDREYDKSALNNIGLLIEPLVIFSRANEESAMKADRCGKAWDKKRANLDKVKLTAQCPSWLRLSKDRTRFEVDPDKVKTIKTIFNWCVDGLGLTVIVKRLNSQGFTPITSANDWKRWYVRKMILRNRAVIGEFQPHRGHVGDRKPVGEPIPCYFPPIINEGLFHKAQVALERRRKKQKGRTGNYVANLFTGLLRDARDGGSMTLVYKRKTHVCVVSALAQRGVKGSIYRSFPYRPLEMALLELAIGLTEKDVMPTASKKNVIESRLADEEGKLANINAKIEKARQRLLEDADFDLMADLLKELQAQQAESKAVVEKLKAEMIQSTDSDLADAKRLVELLEKATGDELTDLRTRIKARLQSLISEVWILVGVRGMRRVALVEVLLREGGTKLVWVEVRGGQLKFAVVKPSKGSKVGLTDLAYQKRFEDLLDGKNIHKVGNDGMDWLIDLPGCGLKLVSSKELATVSTD